MYGYITGVDRDIQLLCSYSVVTDIYSVPTPILQRLHTEYITKLEVLGAKCLTCYPP